MNLNSIVISDPNSLSRDELIEEYDKLSTAWTAYINEKKINESHKQTIHELKSNLQTAQNAESFLATELDAIQSTYSSIIKEIIDKHQIELENLRKRYDEAKEINLSQENDLASMRDTIEELKLQLQDRPKEANDSADRQSQCAELYDEIVKLKSTQHELIRSENLLREKLESAIISKIENENIIVQLEEQCKCLNETLATKRVELEEKDDLYEALQEKVCALSGELASLKNNADLGCKNFVSIAMLIFLYVY